MNKETILEMYSEENDLLQLVCETLLSNKDNYTQELQEALKSEDRTAIEKYSHKFRGALLNFGTGKIINELEYIEVNSQGESIENLQRSFLIVKTEFEAITLLVSELVDELKTPELKAV